MDFYFYSNFQIPLHGCETRINLDGNFENGIIIQDNVGFLQATDKFVWKIILKKIFKNPKIKIFLIVY